MMRNRSKATPSASAERPSGSQRGITVQESSVSRQKRQFACLWSNFVSYSCVQDTRRSWRFIGRPRRFHDSFRVTNKTSADFLRLSFGLSFVCSRAVASARLSLVELSEHAALLAVAQRQTLTRAYFCCCFPCLQFAVKHVEVFFVFFF